MPVRRRLRASASLCGATSVVRRLTASHAAQELNPTMRNITYDINDLYSYIDSMPDLSCLVFDPATGQYAPFTKEWIKKRVYVLLKKQAR